MTGSLHSKYYYARSKSKSLSEHYYSDSESTDDDSLPALEPCYTNDLLESESNDTENTNLQNFNNMEKQTDDSVVMIS